MWHYSLLLMNSFNKTEAAVFSCSLCFLVAFPFISLNKPFYRGIITLVCNCFGIYFGLKYCIVYFGSRIPTTSTKRVLLYMTMNMNCRFTPKTIRSFKRSKTGLELVLSFRMNVLTPQWLTRAVSDDVLSSEQKNGEGFLSGSLGRVHRCHLVKYIFKVPLKAFSNVSSFVMLFS